MKQELNIQEIIKKVKDFSERTNPGDSRRQEDSLALGLVDAIRNRDVEGTPR